MISCRGRGWGQLSHRVRTQQIWDSAASCIMCQTASGTEWAPDNAPATSVGLPHGSVIICETVFLACFAKTAARPRLVKVPFLLACSLLMPQLLPVRELPSLVGGLICSQEPAVPVSPSPTLRGTRECLSTLSKLDSALPKPVCGAPLLLMLSFWFKINTSVLDTRHLLAFIS